MDNNQRAIAIIRLIVPVILSIGTYFGIALDGDLVFLVLMVVASLVAMGWAWWKNNNVTEKAQIVEQAGLDYWHEIEAGLDPEEEK